MSGAAIAAPRDPGTVMSDAETRQPVVPAANVRLLDAAEETVSAPAPITETSKAERALRVSMIGLFIIALFAALYFARALLIPFTLSILLFLTFRPVVRAAARHRIPAGATAAVIVIGLVVAIGTVFYTLSGPVQDAARNAPQIATQVEKKVEGIRDRVTTMIDAARRIQPDEGEIAGEAPPEAEVVVRTEEGNGQMGLVQSVAVNVFGVLATLLVMLVLLFFLLASGSLFYEKLVQSFDRLEDKKQALFAVHEVERDISRYLLTITIINWSLGAAIGTAMWLLGMPNPLLWFVLGAVLNYVPYAGAIVGTFAAFIVALLTYPTVGTALVVPATYYVLTTVEGSLVTPYFVGRRLAINTVSVFLFVAVWAWLWGMWGALMAVPVLVVIKEVCEHVPGGQKIANFLSVRPDITGQDNATETNGQAKAPAAGAPVQG